jgi:hypothetical protein
MGTTQQNVLDGRQVAQLVGLLDSPVDAEAAGAPHRIRVLKKKHGNVPFYELVERPDYKVAIWEKFGNPKCLKGQMETAALVEKLRQDNAQLEKDGAALALAVKRQEQIISELRQHATARPAAHAQGAAAGPASEYFGGFFAFLSVMGAAALLFVGAWLLAAALWGG